MGSISGNPRGDRGPEYRVGLPSIAVLPYFCLRHGTVRREFGDTMTFARSSALMTVSGLQVIAPSSAMRFSKPSQDLFHTAQKLGVRYLLTGQILQHDQTLTLTHKLLDAANGKVVVFTKLDVPIGALHQFECHVLSQILTAVLPEMREAEIQRALIKVGSGLTAHEALLQAMVAMHSLTRANHERAERLLLTAQRLAPNYGSIYAWHARLISIRIGQGWAADRQAACTEALALAKKAIQFDPANAMALATVGHLHSYLLKDTTTGLAYLERALAACPNESLAWLMSGMTRAYIGQAKVGRAHAEYALSLSPYDRFAFMFHSFIATCCYAAGDYEAARHHSILSIEENANYSTTHRVLAATQAALGDINASRKAGAEMLRLEPNYPANAAHTVPFTDLQQRNLFLQHMTVAGIIRQKERLPPEAAE